MILGKWIVVTTLAIGCTVLVGYTAVRNIENFLISDKPRRPSRPLQAVCHTQDCQLDAKAVLQSLNESVDPCDDFYQFACGGFLRDNPVKDKEGKFVIDHPSKHAAKLQQRFENIIKEPPSDKDTVAVNAARTMYKACMDTEKIERDGLQPLLALSNEFGGWPMTLELWEGDNYTSVEIMEITKRLLVSPLLNVLIDLQVSREINETLYIKVKVSPSILSHKNLSRNGDFEDQLEKYKHYIRSTALLVMNKTDNYRNEERVREETNEIVEFEKALDKVAFANCSSESMSLKELQEWNDLNSTAQYDWSSLVSHFLSSAGITEYDEDAVLFRDVSCLKDLVKLVDVTPFRVIANIIQWRIVQHQSKSTINELNQLELEYLGKNATVHDETTKERSTSCLRKLNNDDVHAVSQKLLTEMYNPETDKGAHSLLKNIRSAFSSRIAHAQWDDEEAKRLVIEQADAMRVVMGYMKWSDNFWATDDYDELVNASSFHLNKMIHLNEMHPYLMSKSALGPQTLTEMEVMDSITVNAYYLSSNKMMMSAGMLQPPYFRLGGLEALNYGRIGTAMAHEITHGIIKNIRHVVKYGYSKEWWPDTVNKIFTGTFDCFRQQYDEFRIPELDELMNGEVTVNGTLTFGENIADNGGVSTAFLAYSEYLKQNSPEPKLPGLERYSSEQLFFIGYATVHCSSETDAFLQDTVMTDLHSPTAARIIVPLSNSADFAAAFGCPVGSRMNPDKKCSVW